MGKKVGVIGDMSYAIISYVSTGVSTGAITVPKGVKFVSWTPAVIRASSTIDFTTTAGTITLAGLTSGDTGYIMAYLAGGF